MSSTEQATPTVVNAPVSGTSLWAYACASCRRIGLVYFAERGARDAAAAHDCDKPAGSEISDPTTHGYAYAAVVAAAWATFLDSL